MNSSYHFGDEVTQYGDNNIGMIKDQGALDPQAILQEMLNVVRQLRAQVSDGDRQVIDDSLVVIGNGQNVDKRAFRRALSSIAGVASVVDHVGVPVIESVRKVMSAFGI